MTTRRVQLARDPYHAEPSIPACHWRDGGEWPARWISISDSPAVLPVFAAYRLKFSLAAATSLRYHVTADERFELFLDGQLIDRGPERGDPNHWSFATHSTQLPAGEHIFIARVWSLGSQAPSAQMGVRHGFLLSAEGEQYTILSTGTAPWEARRLTGTTIPAISGWDQFGVGVHTTTDLSDFGAENGTCSSTPWQPAQIGRSGKSLSAAIHLGDGPFLVPASLPPMLNAPRTPGRVVHAQHPPNLDGPFCADPALAQPATQAAFQSMIDGGPPVPIPAGQSLWILIDLGDYVCAYPELTLEGSAGRVTIEFSESLTLQARDNHAFKGRRDEFIGKYWTSFHGDTVIAASGQQTFMPLWFRCGRWLSLTIECRGEPVTIHRLRLFETRYPLEQSASFHASPGNFAALQPVLVRTLQMCAHEVFFDCPFHEQMMYIGDTRLQILAHFSLHADTRLPHRAVRLFHWSRNFRGLPSPRYPVRGRQNIPPFSLVWIAMLDDCVQWTEAEDLLHECIPTARSIIDFWETHRDPATDLLTSPCAWNFIDWVRPEGFVPQDHPDAPRWGEVQGGIKWDMGTPPDGYAGGISGVLNAFYICFLKHAIALETHLGETELAARLRRLQARTFEAWHQRYFSECLGLYADTADHTLYSEHSQCLALLSGLLDEPLAQRVSTALFTPLVPLAETTCYFTHYYFEACRQSGAIDTLLRRQQRWNRFLELGAKTTFEEPEPARSDCHAWSAHPLWHWHTTLLGIRPGSAGFRTVHIQPQLGTLNEASGTMPHRYGPIHVSIQRKGATYTGRVTLPGQLTGTLQLPDRTAILEPGLNTF